MANEMFFHHFGDVAKEETRTLNLMKESYGVPPDAYAFMESYCTDPKCDCRRVLLFVTGQKHGIVAAIGYAFDRNDPMPGPYVDPMNKRAPFADGILRLTREYLLSDPAYVARLERHYKMMKEKCGKPRRSAEPAKQPSRAAEPAKQSSQAAEPAKKAKKPKSIKRQKKFRRPS